MDHEPGGLVRLLDHLLQLIGCQIEPLVMAGINDRQFFPRLGIQRMLLQVFHIFPGQVCRVDSDGLEMFLVFEQPQILHAFEHGEFPPLIRREQHIEIAQMGDALSGAQRKFRFGKRFDDFFEGPARRFAVLADFEVPISERVQREGNILWRMAGLGAQPLDREFGAGQVFEVFGLNLSQEQQALDVRGKPVELLSRG